MGTVRLRALQETETDAMAQRERHLARLLDVDLAGSMERAEVERKQHDLARNRRG